MPVLGDAEAPEDAGVLGGGEEVRGALDVGGGDARELLDDPRGYCAARSSSSA
ncbi:hypothetical protein NBH00_19590 [Paraconexibacter antarcticus]|uniref:Uncharacterized protein n=1 Tax=Paraconexibacter antarcticus TaxID=2949664 RepID=A0ABY5E1T9_9ACTN|nr:hypothetical protein [Paraconexibacter antarcticus]UTI67127.1 hypothetical protein NBH00_19590 [Paraconexibacter antarcticus]